MLYPRFVTPNEISQCVDRDFEFVAAFTTSGVRTMPKNKGKAIYTVKRHFCLCLYGVFLLDPGKGGKNRRRGKNENESDKRELVFKEDGQGRHKECSNTVPS